MSTETDTVTCQCVYNQATHPLCARSQATAIVVLPRGGTETMDVLMCTWCADDWHQHHGYTVLNVAA